MSYPMQIIEPTSVTEAMLISSTAVESHADWIYPHNYAADEIVVRNVTGVHSLFQRLLAGSTPTLPENDSVNWNFIGPSNTWAMYDQKVGTKTAGTGTITNVLRPGPTGGIICGELIGKQLHIVQKDVPGGTVVYDRLIDLDGTQISDVYDWFFAPYAQLTDVTLTDLPYHYYSPELTVSLIGTSAIEMGVCKFGAVHNIGETQLGAQVGMIDYGVKEKDAFGNYGYTDRGFSRRNTYTVQTLKSDFSRIDRLFNRLRGKLCVYIGTGEEGFEPLTTYGAYKDHTIAVTYKRTHLLSIEIEGMLNQ